MRMKRTLAMLLSAMLTLMACVTALPKTGGGAPLGLLASFVLLSGAGLAVSAAGKRRAAKRR